MKKLLVLTFSLSVLMVGLKAQSVSAEAKIKELGIVLPTTEAPIANYVKWTISGNLLFTSGHGPGRTDSGAITGRLGSKLSAQQGYKAAYATGLQLLSTLKAALGTLDRIERILKVTAWVNSEPDFTDQPQVINGFSDLMVAVFGENGRHARTAVGTSTLPNGIPVEIEMVVQFK